MVVYKNAKIQQIEVSLNSVKLLLYYKLAKMTLALIFLFFRLISMTIGLVVMFIILAISI